MDKNQTVELKDSEKRGADSDCSSGNGTTSEDSTSTRSGSKSCISSARVQTYLTVAGAVTGLVVLVFAVPTVFVMLDKLAAEIEQLKLQELSGTSQQPGSTMKDEQNTTLVRDLRDEIYQLQKDIVDLSVALTKARGDNSENGDRGGSTYIRWGKNSCPENTTLLYSGHAGSSITSILLSESEEIYYSNGDGYLTGGGAQYLCMPPNMQWNKYDTTPGDTTAFAWVFAVLFRSFEKGIFPDEAHNTQVVCSLCHTPRPSQIMIPARRECPEGWTLEYEGYLMSGNSEAMSRHTFECVDEYPDLTVSVLGPDQYDSSSHGSMVFVSVMCEDGEGNKPKDLDFCQGFYNAREITCVVCTK